jgi:hypothetical protein
MPERGMAPSNTINTRNAERRSLHFNSIEEVLADVDRILAAESAGTLRRTGNWTVGQTLGHLAAWINYGWDGYPPEANPPWLVKVIIRMFKKRLLSKPMQSGMKLGRIPGGTLGIEPMSSDEGARRLRDGLRRLQRREEPRFHSPALGAMTADERLALNLRHAELHLGFLHP